MKALWIVLIVFPGVLVGCSHPVKPIARQGDPRVVAVEDPIKQNPELKFIDLQSKLTFLLLADDRLSQPDVQVDFDVNKERVSVVGTVPNSDIRDRVINLANAGIKKHGFTMPIKNELTIKR
jgi:hypothetical protein